MNICNRHGHNNMVRKMAIECLIIVSALNNTAVNRYLALMCLHDKDPYISYITAKNLTYFIGLAAQQFESASHAASRKETLKNEIDLMIQIWKPVLDKGRAPEAATKYLKKIQILFKEVFPAKTKIKFKMPSLANLKPDEANVPDMSIPKAPKKKLPKVSKAMVKVEETVVLPDYLLRCLAMVKKLNSTKQGAWFRAPVLVINRLIP